MIDLTMWYFVFKGINKYDSKCLQMQVHNNFNVNMLSALFSYLLLKNKDFYTKVSSVFRLEIWV